MKQVKNQQGYTILELLVVMSIAALISLIAYKSSQTLRDDILQANMSVDVLKEHLDTYYQLHCDDAVFIQPTVSTLVHEGILQDEDSVTPTLGSAFSIYISNIGEVDVLMKVSSEFETVEIAGSVADGHIYAQAVGRVVEWFFKSNLTSSDGAIQSKQLMWAYGDNRC